MLISIEIANRVSVANFREGGALSKRSMFAKGFRQRLRERRQQENKESDEVRKGEANNQPANIVNALNDDVMCDIISFLEPRDVLAVGLVCRAWQPLADFASKHMFSRSPQHLVYYSIALCQPPEEPSQRYQRKRRRKIPTNNEFGLMFFIISLWCDGIGRSQDICAST